MRILHLSPYLPTRSGIATYGHDFATALEGAGNHVDVRRFPETCDRPGTIETLIREVLAFHDALRRWPPDIVHIETAYGLLREFYVLLSLPTSREYKVVVTAHDAPCLAGEPLWFLGRADPASADPRGVLGPRLISDYSFALEKRAYRQADAVIALSRAGARELSSQFGDHPRLEYLPHGVEISPLVTRLPANPLRVLFFGYLHPQKGLDTLLQAVRLLPYRSIALTLAGEPYRLTSDGPDTNSQLSRALVQETEASDFPQPVRWLGYVPDSKVSDVFRTHDVLVLPYKESGLRSTSGVLYRAMAHGLAVVATKVQALPEFIDHERTGLLIEPDSPKALAAGLRRLAADPDEALWLGAQARQFVTANHSWALAARSVSAIYEDLVAARAALDYAREAV